MTVLSFERKNTLKKIFLLQLKNLLQFFKRHLEFLNTSLKYITMIHLIVPAIKL